MTCSYGSKPSGDVRSGSTDNAEVIELAATTDVTFHQSSPSCALADKSAEHEISQADTSRGGFLAESPNQIGWHLEQHRDSPAWHIYGTSPEVSRCPLQSLDHG